MFQALNGGRIISKELLLKNVRPADRRSEGDRFPLCFVEWERNGDPYFYENNHLTPRPVDGSGGSAGGTESWIFYNTPKSSGKKLVVPPGATHTAAERGIYSLLVFTFFGPDVNPDAPRVPSWTA